MSGGHSILIRGPSGAFEVIPIDEERDTARLAIALANVARSLGRFFTIEGAWGAGSWGTKMVDPAMRAAVVLELDLGLELLGAIRRRVDEVAAEVLTKEEIREVERELGIRRSVRAA